jgi:hypothetical protein
MRSSSGGMWRSTGTMHHRLHPSITKPEPSPTADVPARHVRASMQWPART